MYRRVRSRSVRNFSTCKENVSAQCWLPISTRVWTQNSSEVGTAQPHSLCKNWSHAHTSFAFWYEEYIPNLYDQWNASARRLLPATLLKRWPQVCHVKIMFKLLSNNWLISTRMNLMKCFINWIPVNTHVCLVWTQPCFETIGPRKTNTGMVVTNLGNVILLCKCFAQTKQRRQLESETTVAPSQRFNYCGENDSKSDAIKN